MLDRFRLDGKVAVVTGGTGLLGNLYCRSLADAGAQVVIADLDAEACDRLAETINAAGEPRAHGMAVNLADEASVATWAARILQKFGRVDVLVNNAASKSPNFFAPLEQFPLEDWNHVMGVNVTGMFLAMKHLGPSMVERKSGSIVNVSSIYGVVGPDQRIYEGSYYLGGAINTPLIYSASKGAVVAMTRYMATYWGAQGVRTNTLTPGGVSSGQNTTFSEKYSARVPMGKMAEAQDMVGALLFLASDASRYVNGQNLIVDGGLTAW